MLHNEAVSLRLIRRLIKASSLSRLAAFGGMNMYFCYIKLNKMSHRQQEKVRTKSVFISLNIHSGS